MPQPEAYIGHADKLFDATGKLINEGTLKFLQGSWFTEGFGTLDLKEARALLEELAAKPSLTKRYLALPRASPKGDSPDIICAMGGPTTGERGPTQQGYRHVNFADP